MDGTRLLFPVAWLGSHAPVAKIQESGLWQIQKVFGKGLTHRDREEFRRIARA